MEAELHDCTSAQSLPSTPTTSTLVIQTEPELWLATRGFATISHEVLVLPTVAVAPSTDQDAAADMPPTTTVQACQHRHSDTTGPPWETSTSLRLVCERRVRPVPWQSQVKASAYPSAT